MLFTIRSEKSQGYSLSLFLFNILLKVLSSTIGGIKDNQIKEKIKPAYSQMASSSMNIIQCNL